VKPPKFAALILTSTLLVSVFPISAQSIDESCPFNNLRSDQEILDQIRSEIRSMADNRQVFKSVICLAMQLRESRRGGTDVLFQKSPNWYWALRPYFENIDVVKAYGMYQNAPLSFLANYNEKKKYIEMKDYLSQLGYLGPKIPPKRAHISDSDKSKILEKAMSLFCD
jgi:hypothetical protein